MPELSPVVSVLMTAHNREQFIGQAIGSVLASSFTDFELIIVDDQSTDSTVKIARSFQAKDSRVQLHINEKNLGDYANRNRAARLAKGEFIMYCDSDDHYFDHSIEYCVNAMRAHAGIGIGYYTHSGEDSPFIKKGNVALHQHFFIKPLLTIGPGGSIIRRKFFFDIGCYPEKYGPANDMYFNLKACTFSDILLLPKLFLYYRIHDGQEKNNSYSYIHNNYRYLEDALHELPLPFSTAEKSYIRKKNQRRFAVNMLRYFAQTRNFTATRQLWRKARFSTGAFIRGIFHL